jgi:hypothetical protein
MLRILLAPETFAKIDDADLLLVSGFPWRPLQPKPPNPLTYAHAWNGQQHFYMHRLIMGVPPDITVDHANGDGLNNQRYNLRNASRGQQQANRGGQRDDRASSRFKGVHWDEARGKWHVGLGYDGKSHFVGRFTDEEEAAHAYDAAALAQWGGFARLNFPTDNGVVCLQHQMGVPEAVCACG